VHILQNKPMRTCNTERDPARDRPLGPSACLVTEETGVMWCTFFIAVRRWMQIGWLRKCRENSPFA